MSGVFEWPYKHPNKVTLDSPVTPEKRRMDAVYEARISPAESASEAFDIGWREGRNAEREDMETRFWSIVDADGLLSAPSDMWAALETLCRAARNRDMWKGQCERQAADLMAMREALHDAIDRPKGVVPASADRFFLKTLSVIPETSEVFHTMPPISESGGVSDNG